MADSDKLTEAERAELEQLRAEAQARAAAKEREELARLRARKEAEAAEAAREAEIEAARAHGRELMQPDDDLTMPKGQKIVIAVIALFVVAFIVYSFVK